MILKLRLLLCCSMIVRFSYGVDYEYFFSPLRSKKIMTCTSKADKINCQLKCSVDTGLCIRKQCYCLSSYIQGDGIKEQENERRNVDRGVPEYLDESLLLDNKPVLRHHIAHFCPNLQLARTCIRTCMKEGKPAFCGKDHVCYCGHRYSYTDKDSSVNASSVYSEFQDMYEKYFGPNYKQEINV